MLEHIMYNTALLFLVLRGVLVTNLPTPQLGRSKAGLHKGKGSNTRPP